MSLKEYKKQIEELKMKALKEKGEQVLNKEEKERPQILEEMDLIDSNISLEQIEVVEAIQKDAEERGIDFDEKEIEGIYLIDLEQELKEQENEHEVNNEAESLNIDNQNIVTGPETDLNRTVKGERFGKLLNLREYGIPDDGKLAVVTSKSDGKLTRDYTFAVITKQGEKIPVPEECLKADNQLGNDPMQRNYTADVSGTVRDDDVKSSFEINGKNDTKMQISLDETLLGKSEIKIADRSNQRGKEKALELQTEYTAWPERGDITVERNKWAEGDAFKKATQTKIDNVEERKDMGEKEVDIRNANLNQNDDLITFPQLDNEGQLVDEKGNRIPDKDLEEIVNAFGDRGEGAIDRVKERVISEIGKDDKKQPAEKRSWAQIKNGLHEQAELEEANYMFSPNRSRDEIK